MKKTILKLAIIALAGVFVAGGLTSCEENHYYQGAYMKTEFITVKRSEWKWNDIYLRYEAVKPYPIIDNYFYDYGAATCGVYVFENGVDNSGRPVKYETLKPLPFVQTYDEGAGIIYTETISYDLEPGYIIFSIQASDLSNSTDWLETYEFKISLFWPND